MWPASTDILTITNGKLSEPLPEYSTAHRVLFNETLSVIMVHLITSIKMKDSDNARYHDVRDMYVRFRSRDNKVFVGDLMVWAGRYPDVGRAHRRIRLLITRGDKMLDGITSLEEDDMLHTGPHEVIQYFYCILSNVMI